MTAKFSSQTPTPPLEPSAAMITLRRVEKGKRLRAGSHPFTQESVTESGERHVEIRLPGQYAVEWLTDYRRLHEQDRCRCNTGFGSAIPLIPEEDIGLTARVTLFGWRHMENEIAAAQGQGTGQQIIGIKTQDRQGHAERQSSHTQRTGKCARSAVTRVQTPQHALNTAQQYMCSAPENQIIPPFDGYSLPSNTYSSPSNPYQTPENTYRNPPNTWENTPNTTQNLERAYESPYDTYREPQHAYQEPRNTYQNPQDAYQIPQHASQPPPYSYHDVPRAYRDLPQAYQPPRAPIMTIDPAILAARPYPTTSAPTFPAYPSYISAETYTDFIPAGAIP